MRWEEMTSKEFQQAVKKTKGVCIVPVSCLEKHGDHLPLGTDIYFGKVLAEKAAEIEPAIIFPPYYFGQINCAKHVPGTIAVRHQLLMDLLENTCDEIARNGIKKIVLLCSHGGNTHFLQFFAQSLLEKERDYVVYVQRLQDMFGKDEKWEKMVESEVDGHAGEMETSLIMAANPELVKMNKKAPAQEGLPKKRLKDIPSSYTGIWWYSDFPNHYAGQAEFASKKKGEYLVETTAKKIAAFLKAIKKDSVAAKLTQEFYEKARNPSK